MHSVLNSELNLRKTRAAVLTGVTLVACVLLGGLLLWEWHVRRVLKQLEDDKSFDDRARAISALWKLPARQRVLKRVFDRWGRNSEAYDIVIVEFINELASDTTIHFNNDIIDVISSRIKEDPTLLRQIDWHDRWERQQIYLSMPDAARKKYDEASDGADSEIVLVARYLQNCYNRPATSKILWLLRAASMVDQPEALNGVTLESVDAHISALASQMRRDAPFFVFDERTRTFRVDECAKNSGSAVTARRQRASVPRFHLPRRSEWH